MLRIIAIDLDGTLLSSNQSIHEKNIEAIKTAQQQGDIVAIATGRALFDALHITEKYGLRVPIIAANGAQLFVNGFQLNEQYINENTIYPLLQWLKEEKLYFQVYLSDKIVLSDLSDGYLTAQLRHVVTQNPLFDTDHFLNSIKAQQYQYGLEEVPSPILPTTYPSIIKLMVVSPNTTKLMEAKAFCHKLEGIEVSSSGSFNIEIMTSGIDKGTALHQLCEYYGISVKHTVTIGDNQNDIPMFKVAGKSIAMGNADDELVNMATYKTLTNDDCGVAYAFDHFIHEQTTRSIK
ncbi:Cof-type HAD-IIB family hydrolase [Bacillus spongiae]|uniref:Cof-type HAD-IIB family hydrolase n=1 Tax=Bacillus spongiae TaxID=2683610 RepID=A0ABU8HE33_9BACI